MAPTMVTVTNTYEPFLAYVPTVLPSFSLGMCRRSSAARPRAGVTLGVLSFASFFVFNHCCASYVGGLGATWNVLTVFFGYLHPRGD